MDQSKLILGRLLAGCLFCAAVALGVRGNASANAHGLDVDLREGGWWKDPALAFAAADAGASWIRLRGIPGADDAIGAVKAREVLAEVRRKGTRTCIILRSNHWQTYRSAGGSADIKRHLPSDLREAHGRGRAAAVAFGGLVDAWEIDNEPDLAFVPENAEAYTAFLKAMYWGIKAGAKQTLFNGSYGLSVQSPNNQERITQNSSAPLVLMAPLGLPPGPWLERFAANDGFAYTDGYNYHYYGYAADFTGVYSAHERAAKELGAGSLEQRAQGSRLVARSYPIFLTEIGYGMLNKQARDTKEGRLRQWRWFKSVGEQVTALRIEAPMAFVLPPYLEYDVSEYGLTVPPAPSANAAAGSEERGAGSFKAGGIEYVASDFQLSGFSSQVSQPEPWMDLIGRKIGGNEATPALAAWLAERAKVGRVVPNAPNDHGGLGTTRPTHDRGGSQLSVSVINNDQPSANNPTGAARSWQISTPAPTPVVIDFLAGEGLATVKRYNGHFAMATEAIAVRKPETGDLKPEEEPKTKSPEPRITTPPPAPRTEGFILMVRTANGSLFEVYPMRMASPGWQQFLEEKDNFNLSPYGRAGGQWRLADSRPVSLVLSFYPKRLPAVYEFRHAQLTELKRVVSPAPKIGDGSSEMGEAAKPEGSELSTPGAQPSAATHQRHGVARVVLYNFSDRPVTGRLELPEEAGLMIPGEPDQARRLTLAPRERRGIPVAITVPADAYARHRAEVRFLADDAAVPPARLVTEFLPALERIPTVKSTALLGPRAAGDAASANARIIRERTLVAEEAPSHPQASPDGTFTAFAQAGLSVERTPDGFRVVIMTQPPDQVNAGRVEIPWPDDVDFPDGTFLSLGFRLGEVTKSDGKSETGDLKPE